MKWTLSFLFAAVITGCTELGKKKGHYFASPEEYNNYIIDRQKEVGRIVSSFYEVLTSNPDSAKQLLDHGLQITGESLQEIRSMPDYHGDTSFRGAAINSFRFYNRLFAKDYDSILSMHSLPGIISEKDAVVQQLIINKIVRDEEKCDKDLHNRQKDFAERYHMRMNND